MRNLVVIPTYNEAPNIAKVLELVLAADASLDIVVIDDNSPDGTASVVREFAKKEERLKLIVRESKLGLGSAYVAGFKYAIKNNYDLVFEMDADFSHNPEVLPELLKNAREYDYVIGSRYLNGISVVNWPLRRLALSLM